MRVLFVCSRNRFRSPTAERLFDGVNGHETGSAGVRPDSEEPISADWIDWADIIVAMEASHRKKLNRDFGELLKGKRIAVLNIPDDFQYMDPELIRLLGERVSLVVPELAAG